MDFFWSLPKARIEENGRVGDELFDASQVRRHEANVILSDPEMRRSEPFSARAHAQGNQTPGQRPRDLITVLEPGSIWSDRSLLKATARSVIETMSPAETISIEREAFERYVFAKPERLTKMMSRISEQISDALTLLEDFRGRDVASRLASVLVRFSKEHGVQDDRSVVIDIPFTHQDLANMIGTARETVSRNMARFRAEGYVRDCETPPSRS